MHQALIVALPVGNQTVTYNDGDVAQVHETLIHLGDSALLTNDQVEGLASVVGDIADSTKMMYATVCGKGTLGPDSERVVLTESGDLVNLREALLARADIYEIVNNTKQHPWWISHISGMQNLQFGDYVIFDRLALWVGEDRREFKFSNAR